MKLILESKDLLDPFGFKNGLLINEWWEEKINYSHEFIKYRYLNVFLYNHHFWILKKVVKKWLIPKLRTYHENIEVKTTGLGYNPVVAKLDSFKKTLKQIRVEIPYIDVIRYIQELQPVKEKDYDPDLLYISEFDLEGELINFDKKFVLIEMKFKQLFNRKSRNDLDNNAECINLISILTEKYTYFGTLKHMNKDLSKMRQDLTELERKLAEDINMEMEKIKLLSGYKIIRAIDHMRRLEIVNRILIVQEVQIDLKNKLIELRSGISEFKRKFNINIINFERTCFQCKAKLSFEDFYDINFIKGIESCIKIWNSPNLQFLCCRCYYQRFINEQDEEIAKLKMQLQ